MDLMLKDKVAVITGGGSGIGEASAIMFAEEGVQVVVADLSEEHGRRVAEEIRDKGGEAIFVRVDVARRDEVQAMVRETLERFGKIDILANIAGNPAQGDTVEEWDDIFAVHARGTFNCTQEVLPSMRERRYGKIVNMGSFCAYGMGEGAYASAKGAIISYTKGLAKSVARYNINANSVSPGNILTPMTQGWIGTGEQRARFEATIPLGRLGQPEDVVAVVVFLSSDRARHITGADINISGGQLIY